MFIILIVYSSTIKYLWNLTIILIVCSNTIKYLWNLTKRFSIILIRKNYMETFINFSNLVYEY